MKTFQIFLSFFIVLSLSSTAIAQTKTEKIKVNGVCGMCKSKIETAAKKAGASFASWDADSKELTVKYNTSSSDAAKIQKSVAASGYDTQDVKATDEAYDKLHACCKYERSSSEEAKSDAKTTGHSCAADHKCTKDGKCDPDKSCCKDKNCTEKDCCKKD